MNFTLEEISAIIGMKELENISLRRELAKVQAELAKHTEAEPVTTTEVAE